MLAEIKREGFTLVELLIVLAIVGLIVVIAISKISELVACGGEKRLSNECRKWQEQRGASANSPREIVVNGVRYKRDD